MLIWIPFLEKSGISCNSAFICSNQISAVIVAIFFFSAKVIAEVVSASGHEQGGVIKNFPESFLLTAAAGEEKGGGKGRQNQLWHSQRCISCVK